MKEEENEVLDYDGEIENDGDSFSVLPEGDEVTYTVKKVEKGRNKDGTLPQVRVSLLCVSNNGHGRATVIEFFTMTRKSEWKLCEFFSSLGMRRHGERLKMRWDIEGCSGIATVGVESYTKRDGDDGQSNRIKRFKDAEDAAPAAAAAGGVLEADPDSAFT